jgi:hypothetical protein
VHGIKAFRLLFGHVNHLHGNNLQFGLFEALDHLSDEPASDAVRLHDRRHGTGFDGMQEALQRMENGEDPEQIEADMGDILENEDPFVPWHRKRAAVTRRKRPAPATDETLYDL